MAQEVMPNQLANSIMAKFYDVLTNGDDTVPQSEDNFFSWSTPAIPVAAEDFEFLTQGFTGVVKKQAVEQLVAATAGAQGSGDGSAGPGLSEAELEKLRASDTARLYQQAEYFSRLVDFIPDVTRADVDQFARLSVLNNEGTLSDVYSKTLRMSQVMESELPAETKAKIEKLRQLLSVTVKKKDLITDEEVEVSEPSPMVKAYHEKMAAYEAAALNYNTHRIDALTAADAQAVHYWAMNANILRNKVKAAMSDWVSTGYKDDYEKISAFLDQVMERDMALLKQEYRDDLERARITGAASGSDFFYTSLAPASFATSGGWTRFTFGSTDVIRDSSSSFSSRRWSAGASAGFLGIGASAGHGKSATRQEFQGSLNLDTFSLSFEICQVPLIRAWFKQAFLSSRSWRFDQNNPEVKGEMISDGGAPPTGLMPAYPTMAIFVRNLRLGLGHIQSFDSFMSQFQSSSTDAGVALTFGPLNLGGSYSRASASGSEQRHHEYHWDGQSITVDGMQIVGFKCHVMPKCPDPLPEIKKWI